MRAKWGGGGRGEACMRAKWGRGEACMRAKWGRGEACMRAKWGGGLRESEVGGRPA